MNKLVNPYVPHIDKFECSHEFSYLAKFYDDNDVYTIIPSDDYEYRLFWEDVKYKCLNGFTNSKGIRITGIHFYYLNFCRISAFDEIINKKREMFPKFIDLDYEYFHMIEYCEKNQKSILAVKGRRQGWSYKAACVASHEFSFYPGSSSIIGAFLSSFSLETMKMAKENLDWLNANTEFRKQRNPDLKEYVMARYQVDSEGVKIWKGYKSQIRSISFKDNPMAAVGKSCGKLILDEAGVFPNITETYGYTEPLIKAGARYSGIAIIFGSSGDMDSGSKFFYEMFTNPSKYNLLEFEDPESPGKKIAFFSTALMGHEGFCLNPNSKHFKEDLIDINGNSNIEATYDHLMFLRDKAKGGLDPKALHSVITQFPTSWQEAFLRNKGAIFSSPEMLEWLGEVETTPSIRDSVEKGELIFKDGDLEFQPNDSLNYITSFPLTSDEDRTGCIAIWERPEYKSDQNPYSLYVAGCLTPGEKVLTGKGLKNVEDVQIEDQLINDKGEYVNIINRQRYLLNNEDTYNIKVSNTFRRTNFTKEHPILISKPNYKINYKTKHSKYKFNEGYWDFNFDYIKSENLEVGDYIKVPNIYKDLSGDTFEDKWTNNNSRIDRRIKNPINNPNFWWLVGLWLGDGWCEANEHKITISINNDEIEYSNKLINIVNELFNRKVNIKKSEGCSQYSFSFKQLSQFLTTNFGKYARNKNPKEWVKFISKENKENLLLGYLGSDGCITKHTKGYNSMEFVSISLELLESIQDIAFSIGLISNLSKLRDVSTTMFRGKESNTCETYHLRFGNEDTLEFGKRFDYKDYKLSKIDISIKARNKQKTNCFFDEEEDYIYFKITEIEKSKYTGYVYNFECDTHTFMCHHITTHNCDPYDMDKSESGSLGSFYIYKRFIEAGKSHDIVVAEYTGRPKFADDFYENCRRLCIYYNAKVLYENQLKGMKNYFNQKNSLHYLWEQPDHMIKDIIKDSKVQRGYGVHMNRGTNGSSGIKDMCELYTRDWLYTERTDLGPGKFNFHTIKSIALLKELISYDMVGNFDRVVAFMLSILQTKELHKLHVDDMINRTSLYSDDKYLSKSWNRKAASKIKFNII